MHHDVLIIGGAFAGLSAANVLGRARQDVLVVDAGAPRNRFSAHAHNMLGHDGRAGAEILADARKQLAAYPNVEFWNGRVEDARSGAGGFTARLDDGREASARRLILATGVNDVLPKIAGLAERWGQTVLHCPYCHGYEIGGGRIGVLAANAHAAQHAVLLSNWGDITLFANEVELSEEGLELLRERGVAVVEGAVVAIEGAAPRIDAIRLARGERVTVEALFIPVSARPSPLAEKLGCALEDTPAGPIITVDALKRTSVAGVYAAGDTARGMHSVVFAAADGMLAGVALHRDSLGL